MKMFRARVTREISNIVYSNQSAFSDVKPGIPLRLYNDGTMDPPGVYWDLGVESITYENLFRMYICQSWKDSINMLGNEMGAMIPITQPFSALAIVTLDDFAEGSISSVAELTPSTLLYFETGKLTSIENGLPPIFHVVSNPVAMFNGEYEIEVATWGLRRTPEA